MKYTTYFSALIKEQGQLNLNDHQFKRLMNIVSTEGTIRGLNKLKAKLPVESKYKYDLIIFRWNSRLTELTGNLVPADLLREMVQR